MEPTPTTGPISRTPPAAMLDLRRLAVLREVASRGSFAGAAHALSFTPSAVSQQMASLAREMDVVLFERTPRGMRPTAAAQSLLTHCEAVFAELSDAQADLDALAGGVRGRLRLGSFPTATVAFTAAAMDAFRRRCPEVEIYFADGEPYESVARLKERELDLAVLFDFDNWTAATNYDGRAVCADDDIECVELFDDPFNVVLPRDHPLADAEIIELGDLAGERVIGSPSICSPWGNDFRRLCQQAGFEPDFEAHYRSADFAALQAIVATGRGITLVPELALPLPDTGTVVRPLSRGPVRHVRIATLASITQSPACDAMVAVLQEATAALASRNEADRARSVARSLRTQRGEALPGAHPDRLALPLSHGADHVGYEAPSGMRSIDTATRLASVSAAPWGFAAHSGGFAVVRSGAMYRGARI